MPTFAAIGDWIEVGLEWVCKEGVTVLEDIVPAFPTDCRFDVICTKRAYDYLHGAGYQARNGLYTFVRDLGRRHGLQLSISYRVGS